MVTGVILPTALKVFGAFFLGKYAIDLALGNNNILTDITDSINGLVDFFISVKELFFGILDLFPTPFTTVLKVFLALMFTVFLWKLLKGGG